ncbi:hypothetical protein J3A83DRAFT_4374907 [Scleroderma citrinum]
MRVEASSTTFVYKRYETNGPVDISPFRLPPNADSETTLRIQVQPVPAFNCELRIALPRKGVMQFSKQDHCDNSHPGEESVGTYGVEPTLDDTSVQTVLAGCFVATSLLGVGDRYLGKLLLAADGGLIASCQDLILVDDILGRDPPPVKVCKEMVDGLMGGAESTHHVRFKNISFTAFTILSKSANLILDMVALMDDANIKHRDAHEQIHETFRLDLTEEKAIKHREALLNEMSYFAVVLDRIHDLARH